MKNLILTLSVFILLPLTVHANGLMKFKRVKAGENVTHAKKVNPPSDFNVQYAMGLRSALVDFMIQLENDVELEKVSRSDSQRILQILRDNLLIAEAYAQKLVNGSKCFAGGWPSTIKDGVCQIPAKAKQGCGANQYKCSETLFGANTCVAKTAKGFTASCEKKTDPEKIREGIVNDQDKLAQMQSLNKEAEQFCGAWEQTKTKKYDGCDELKKRTAALSANPEKVVIDNTPPREKAEIVKIESKINPIKDPTIDLSKHPLPLQISNKAAVQGGGKVVPGELCKKEPASGNFVKLASIEVPGEMPMNNRSECKDIKEKIEQSLNRKIGTKDVYSASEQKLHEDQLKQYSFLKCEDICSDPAEDERLAEEEANRQRQEQAARTPGKPNVARMGSKDGTVDNYGCYVEKIDCLKTLTNLTKETEDIGVVGAGDKTKAYFKDFDKTVNLENPYSFINYFMGEEVGLAGALADYQSSITPIKFCRLLASACKNPSNVAGIVSYNQCLQEAQTKFLRPLTVGVEKTIAIVAAAKETTEFEEGKDYGGMPFECRGNKGDNAGLGFDYPKCKKFYNWYVGLEASTAGFKVGNEAALISENTRNQERLTQQMEGGNGQNAGFDAARNASIASQKAEERNAGFFAAKGGLILAQLNNWPNEKNICGDVSCCALFNAEGGDKIQRDFFPNRDAKNHIYAQAIAATTESIVAAFRASMHKQNAGKVEAIKQQMQFADESDEGVMKFCLQFPKDVRCLGPGERRDLGASGTQFGGFQGTNFGLGSLDSQQGTDVSLGQDFGGSLAAAGKGPAVSNIGSSNKEAAAAKSIFNAPAPARGGGGGGGEAGGGGGGGGGGGSAQAGQLSRDEGLNEEKKENPIEITSKTGAYVGSKGGYNGGGYNPSNKKPTDLPAANPFAGMFGKDKGRDPANVEEIDKPASDLFAKISRRYEEVQKRKALIEVVDESNGIR